MSIAKATVSLKRSPIAVSCPGNPKHRRTKTATGNISASISLLTLTPRHNSARMSNPQPTINVCKVYVFMIYYVCIWVGTTVMYDHVCMVMYYARVYAYVCMYSSVWLHIRIYI